MFRRMAKIDTSMGGQMRAFPDTTWGLVNELRSTDKEESLTGFERLYQRYWKPVYCFTRIAWSRTTNEEAKDLTQAFFTWLAEKDVLAKYMPEKGSLRTFIKVLLRRFLSNQDEAKRRIKRGGGVKHLSLDIDIEDGKLEELIPDPRADNPEEAFDATWKTDLVDRAIENTRGQYQDGKRAVHFKVFEMYALAPEDDRPTYKEIAKELKIKVTDVGYYLFAVREKLRAEIRTELSDTVGNPKDFEDEWEALFGA